MESCSLCPLCIRLALNLIRPFHWKVWLAFGATLVLVAGLALALDLHLERRGAQESLLATFGSVVAQGEGGKETLMCKPESGFSVLRLSSHNS